MRTKAFGLCAVTAAGLLAASASGQVVWCDSLDTYVPGFVVGQDCIFGTDCNPAGCPVGNSWQGWDFDPNASRSLVVDDPSLSGPNSLQISFATTDDLIHTYVDLGLTSGVYAYEAWQFIPTSATDGSTWFNLFNRYDGMPPHDNPDWSVATEFNMATDEVLAWAEGGTLPLVKGEWVQIRVVLNLDDDTQEIFYNGDLLVAKSWSGGVAEGGLTELQAIDLFAASGSTAVFYDDLSITELEPFGACCFADSEGTCLDGQISTECTDAGGVFQGIGSACFDGRCPVLGPDGWELEAPVVWDASQGRNDTCDYPDTCEEVYPGNDYQVAVTIPWASNWTFSTAGSALLDTEMLIGTSGLCSEELVNDGGCVGEGCSGSQDSEGNQAVFTLALVEDDVVYVDLEEFSGDDCGEIDLAVTGPCAAIDLPEGDLEGEACDPPAEENAGCIGEEPFAFTPIALGQTYLGTSWTNGGFDRDTDWYELVLTEDTEITITGYAEGAGTFIYGVIAYVEGMEGSGNCADTQNLISPLTTSNRCSDYPGENTAELTTTLVAGTWFLFCAPATGSASFTCTDAPGANYWMKVAAASSCTLHLDGDVDPFPAGNGVTNFDDLLLVLSKWGTDGSEGGDSDCDGDVDFDDLLNVLSGWD